VLRVIGERPGVSARELADASQVTGGTLYSLLRRLADDGTVEKRELPGGQTGYALAMRPALEQSAAARPQTATPDEPRVESPAAEGPEQDGADATETADPARSTATEAQPRQAPPSETTDADQQPTPRSDR
jgi:Winged helix-turn-helix DNA-binding